MARRFFVVCALEYFIVHSTFARWADNRGRFLPARRDKEREIERVTLRNLHRREFPLNRARLDVLRRFARFTRIRGRRTRRETLPFVPYRLRGALETTGSRVVGVSTIIAALPLDPAERIRIPSRTPIYPRVTFLLRFFFRSSQPLRALQRDTQIPIVV